MVDAAVLQRGVHSGDRSWVDILLSMSRRIAGRVMVGRHFYNMAADRSRVYCKRT